MRTITAVIKAKAGAEDTIKQALLDVAQAVARDEPETMSFFVSQDTSDSTRFTTHERFVNEEAMNRHNESAASKAFFAAAQGKLDGPVTLVIGEEAAQVNRLSSEKTA